MVSYWIFNVVDAYLGNSRIDAYDILKFRAQRLYWLLNAKSMLFRKVKKEDRVVFYVGGKNAKFFGGYCLLSTNPKRLIPEIKRYVIEDPEDRFNYIVNLKEVTIFDKPKQVLPLLKSLSFVKDERNWGRYFQGSIIKIDEGNYRTITQNPAP